MYQPALLPITGFPAKPAFTHKVFLLSHVNSLEVGGSQFGSKDKKLKTRPIPVFPLHHFEHVGFCV